MISTVTIKFVINESKWHLFVIILSTEDKGSGPDGADCWSQVAAGCDLARSGRQAKTTALCTAKVTARAFGSRFGGIET